MSKAELAGCGVTAFMFGCLFVIGIVCKENYDRTGSASPILYKYESLKENEVLVSNDVLARLKNSRDISKKINYADVIYVEGISRSSKKVRTMEITNEKGECEKVVKFYQFYEGSSICAEDRVEATLSDIMEFENNYKLFKEKFKQDDDECKMYKDNEKILNDHKDVIDNLKRDLDKLNSIINKQDKS